MEVDLGMGINGYDGVYFLYASTVVAAEVAKWSASGIVPRTFRPPGHTYQKPRGAGPMRKIPDDWVPIVRPVDL